MQKAIHISCDGHKVFRLMLSPEDCSSNRIPHVQRVDRLFELISALYAPCRFGEQKVIKETQTQERKELALLPLERPAHCLGRPFSCLPCGLLAWLEGQDYSTICKHYKTIHKNASVPKFSSLFSVLSLLLTSFSQQCITFKFYVLFTNSFWV